MHGWNRLVGFEFIQEFHEAPGYAELLTNLKSSYWFVYRLIWFWFPRRPQTSQWPWRLCTYAHQLAIFLLIGLSCYLVLVPPRSTTTSMEAMHGVVSLRHHSWCHLLCPHWLPQSHLPFVLPLAPFVDGIFFTGIDKQRGCVGFYRDTSCFAIIEGMLACHV